MSRHFHFSVVSKFLINSKRKENKSKQKRLTDFVFRLLYTNTLHQLNIITNCIWMIQNENIDCYHIFVCICVGDNVFCFRYCCHKTISFQFLHLCLFTPTFVCVGLVFSKGNKKKSLKLNINCKVSPSVNLNGIQMTYGLLYKRLCAKLLLCSPLVYQSVFVCILIWIWSLDDDRSGPKTSHHFSPFFTSSWVSRDLIDKLV